MVTKVYLASRLANGPEVEKVANALEATGEFQVTCRWWKYDLPQDARKVETLRHIGLADAQGVLEADLVVVMLTDPTYAYRGSMSELGIALGAGKHVACVAPFNVNESFQFMGNPFVHLASVHRHPSRDYWGDMPSVIRTIQQEEHRPLDFASVDTSYLQGLAQPSAP